MDTSNSPVLPDSAGATPPELVTPEARSPQTTASGTVPWLALGGVLGLAGVLLVALFVILPLVRSSEPEGLVFDIPAGAARSIEAPTIDSAIAIPTTIRFGPGEAAVITIRNFDNVPHRAGPFVVGAGQTFIQRFPAPGEYPIACAVDPAESIVVTVEA